MLRQEVESLRKDITSKLDTLTTITDGIKTRLDDLASEQNKLKLKCDDLEKKNTETANHVRSLQQEIISLHQRSRIDNLEIVGIPETTGENLINVLERLSKPLKLNFKEEDVSVVHRVPTKKGDTSIIVKFTSRRKKAAWLAAAKLKKGIKLKEICNSPTDNQVYINEHLSPFFKRLFGKAKELRNKKKLMFVWIKDCKIFVKESKKSRTTRITCDEDLDIFNGD
ncbi:uncharacterized protein LOC120354626 [Nilaparvata lugens]|uniref:uncharacterized protein LOC120354626 n=1 Tax=Nilaparvata lugens TaxID=108931 RepID=UPI00193E4BA9|nr:uncharacterized protein LOC120354626 [Nilaparvata lugens]